MRLGYLKLSTNQALPLRLCTIYLWCSWVGGANGEESIRAQSSLAIWVQQLLVPSSWLMLLLSVPAKLGKGLGVGCLSSSALSCLPARTLLASVLARVSKTDEIQSRIQQNHSKDTCWQQEALDYTVNEHTAQGFCPFCFCFALSLISSCSPWALGAGAQM